MKSIRGIKLSVEDFLNCDSINDNFCCAFDKSLKIVKRAQSNARTIGITAEMPYRTAVCYGILLVFVFEFNFPSVTEEIGKILECHVII